MEPSTLLGDKGGLRYGPNDFSYHTTYCDLELDCTGDLDAMDWRWRHILDTEEYYCSSQAHWAAALNGLIPLLPTAELAMETMLISEVMYLSSNLKREVTREEVIQASGTIDLKL